MSRKKKPQIDSKRLLKDCIVHFRDIARAVAPSLEDQEYHLQILMAEETLRQLEVSVSESIRRAWELERAAKPSEPKTFPNGIQIVEAERPE